MSFVSLLSLVASFVKAIVLATGADAAAAVASIFVVVSSAICFVVVSFVGLFVSLAQTFKMPVKKENWVIENRSSCSFS